ncbi:MAG: hypothetical protein GTO54_02405 [Nitrososphaeria archaeon]|nr:hypothetical protein [Nitrososphaeria archaeon]
MASFKIRGRRLKAIHVVASPPERDVELLDFSGLRRRAYRMAMACGVFGGSIIFHPFRRFNEDDILEDVEEGFSHQRAPACWYLSPHFHIIGYGWVHRVAENYVHNGWVIKNLGVRKSVRATAHYQLSHCGVNKRFHTVVWFGALSYGKLRAPPYPEQKHPCPMCGREMRRVRFVDPGDASIVESSLEEEELFYVDPGVFCYVESISRLAAGGG